MNIKSFFKKLFGIAKKEVEVVVETKVEPAVEAFVKQKIQEIDVEKATKAIETRLAEIAEEKKAEAKVTAKEIKAKVKKTPEVKAEKPAVKTKPAAKPAKTEKPATKPAKTSRKKTDK
jgi:predicted RNA-binding protein Jag